MITTAPLDIASLRADFPLLAQVVGGQPLAYLDSAATAQKPAAVLAALDTFYRTTNANVHRGVYQLSEAATAAYEGARRTIGRFVGAASAKEVILTSGTTASINLVAQSWGRANLRPGDRVLVSAMEHHSNIVPWQLVAQQTGAQIDVLPFDPQGRLVLADLDTLLGERTRMVAVTHVSNVFGTINPVAELAARAHAVGALLLVDAAQSVPHMPVDVQALGCDFLVFSGHKMGGPTGTGVLWGRRALLEAMPPWMGGGDMIRQVTFAGSTWNDLPWKFEAGTPHIAGAIGLAAACEYLSGIGMAAIHARESQLASYLLDRLAAVPGLTVLGPPAAERAGLAAFDVAGVHPHDVAAAMDSLGVAIRAGHHCAQPLHDQLGLAASARASCYLYTTEAEIDRLASGLAQLPAMFGLQ